jgi:hypothetical protein
MANRKQRRRRDKTFRHEYGFVTYDEEGNEVEVESAELRERKPEKPKPAPGKKAQRSRTTRTTREPPEPSWSRSIRRGGIWGGVMFVIVLLFFTNMPMATRVFMGLLYAAAFIPLTYWIDRMAYRSWQKRQARSAGR